MAMLLGSSVGDGGATTPASPSARHPCDLLRSPRRIPNHRRALLDDDRASKQPLHGPRHLAAASTVAILPIA